MDSNKGECMLRVTPENITELKRNEVFVFGSNYSGRHGSGAARLARDEFGAVYGEGLGMTGQCYAIATKNTSIRTISLRDIEWQVNIFMEYAEAHPELTFLVTQIGCGLAGYTPEQIAPMFLNHIITKNVYLPQCFWDLREGADAIFDE
jgi:hypothetical protein